MRFQCPCHEIQDSQSFTVRHRKFQPKSWVPGVVNRDNCILNLHAATILFHPSHMLVMTCWSCLRFSGALNTVPPDCTHWTSLPFRVVERSNVQGETWRRAYLLLSVSATLSIVLERRLQESGHIFPLAGTLYSEAYLCWWALMQLILITCRFL